MHSKRTTLALIVGAAVLWPSASLTTSAQDATPTMTYTCEDVAAAGSAGMPAAMMGGMAIMGTPMAGKGQMAMELDQMYIDMMIPHHASIIAMAEAALPRLSDERLQEIAQAIIDAQGPEIEELRGHREAFYGDAAPMPLDPAMMTAMDQMMPGMMSGMMDSMPGMRDMMAGMMEAVPGMTEERAGMTMMMNAGAQVAAICAAGNTDLAFIELTIAHHQMAIAASRVALEQAEHPELRDFARRVIDGQQREIDELTAIRQDLSGEATPGS